MLVAPSAERVPVQFIQWNFAWQILPGVTINELRSTDRLGRYVAMGRGIANAPEMWYEPVRDEFVVDTDPEHPDRFPRSSVFRYRLA